jgi:hypothetical protein
VILKRILRVSSQKVLNCWISLKFSKFLFQKSILSSIRCSEPKLRKVIAWFKEERKRLIYSIDLLFIIERKALHLLFLVTVNEHDWIVLINELILFV